MTDIKSPVNGKGFPRLYKAMQNAIAGYRSAWLNEEAFRIEVILALLMFPLSFLLASSWAHWGVLLGSLFLVIITELLNSAIEALTDRVGLEHHHLSGRAKDMGAAAVNCSLVFVTLLWGQALWLKYWA